MYVNLYLRIQNHLKTELHFVRLQHEKYFFSSAFYTTSAFHVDSLFKMFGLSTGRNCKMSLMITINTCRLYSYYG